MYLTRLSSPLLLSFGSARAKTATPAHSSTSNSAPTQSHSDSEDDRPDDHFFNTILVEDRETIEHHQKTLTKDLTVLKGFQSLYKKQKSQLNRMTLDDLRTIAPLYTIENPTSLDKSTLLVKIREAGQECENQIKPLQKNIGLINAELERRKQAAIKAEKADKEKLKRQKIAADRKKQKEERQAQLAIEEARNALSQKIQSSSSNPFKIDSEIAKRLPYASIEDRNYDYCFPDFFKSR